MHSSTLVHPHALSTVALTILLGLAAPAQAQVTFDWATIGDPGNGSDPATGNGAVSYGYRIAKTEVTNTQYAAFLNAVAVDDPHALYNELMAGPHAGIVRTGVPGGYSYDVVLGRGAHPVVYVSFLDAMRFVNWLHNGQGSGDTESGVYEVEGGGSESRAPNATVFLPSRDERYKAAFHQPAAQGGDDDDYWAYPTQGNQPPIVGVGVNYAGAVGDTTPVASYPPNYYGAFDMGGNVWEWTEELPPLGSARVVRGDGWPFSPGGGYLASGYFLALNPAEERNSIGFRIAAPLPCPCDWNNDGNLNDQDFFDWVNDYFTQTGPTGQYDFNTDGFQNDQDFFDFVNCYFAPPEGC